MIRPIRTWTKSAWNSLLNLVYPPVCQICRQERAGAKEGYIGGKCWTQVQFLTQPFCERCGVPYQGQITGKFTCANCDGLAYEFRFARSAVVTNALMLQVIHRYKYSGALYFEPFLADLFLRQALPALAAEKWDLIVPVPLHPARARERGFNQAERLAHHLGRGSGIPIRTDVVKRVKPTETQTHLNRPQRAENVIGAFAPIDGKKLHGERVIVVDDVMTTGATTSACAAIVRQAGAGDVCVWTVVRGA